MKNLILVFFCFLSFNTFAQSSYIISGNVKNIPAKKIFIRLQKTAKDNHTYWPKIDSALVVNGKFILTRDTSILSTSKATIGYVDSVSKKAIGLKYINPTNGKKVDQFILENAEISIIGDVKNAEGLKITGSNETNFNFKYEFKQPIAIYKIDQKISLLKQKNKADELKKALNERETIISSYKAEIKNIIIQHKGTHGAVLLLINNAKFLPTTDLEICINLLDKPLLKTPKGKFLVELLALNKLLEEQKAKL